MKDYVYHRIRPQLAIELTGGAKLGNCYYSSTYRVTSWWRLKRDDLDALKAAGLLGSGQEYIVRSQCDGKEPPAGHDMTPCVVFVNGKATDEPPINEYTKTHIKPISQEFFSYDIERRVDSSD